MNLTSWKIFFNILIIFSIIKTIKASSKKELNYRLTDIITPSHYDIELKTYLLENKKHPEKRFTFDGTTKITLSTKSKYVDKIILNAKYLNISEVHIQLASEKAAEIEGHIAKYDNETEKVTISLKKYLEPGQNYTLELIYTGKMGNRVGGFYKSSYDNDQMEKVYIGATMFRPTNARMVFPCFDEPKFKATFQLRINREYKYQTTSNTKLSHSIPALEQRSIDVFKITPIMSTFGLAFFISDFQARRPTFSDGDISVLAQPKDYLKTKFATEAAPRILQKLNEFTALPYSSTVNTEKLDLIPYPLQGSNGMTHFGLISFREDNILNNLDEKDIENLANTIEYLAHEMAHLWFGGLVTPEWWNYNWLSEGLANYVGYVAANEAFPEYDFDQLFIKKITMAGLMHDCYKTNPLANKTDENVSDLSDNFNVITYRKGPAIIQMIAHMMGPKWFRITLRKYLKKHLYKSVTNEDLIKILKDDWRDNHLNIRTFLADWTEQVGYPVVTVHLKEDGKSMKITQKRFLIDPESKEDNTLQYTIPFTYTTNVESDFDNTETKKYLRKNNEEEINLNHKADWVVANIQFVGYYRVNYDEKNWLNIMEALKSDNFGGIHVKNRAQIVNDILQFGINGLLDYELIFKILEYLEKEEEYLPWSKIPEELNSISKRLKIEEKRWLKKYELSIVRHIYDKLSFHDGENDKPLDIYNRIQIREIACRAGHADCILKAKDVFDDQIYNKKSIPQNMRPVVFCTAVREYGQIYVDYLWNLYKSGPFEELDRHLQYSILSGLSCTRKKEDIFKLLDLIWVQDNPSLLIYTIGSYYENSDDIIQYFVDRKEQIAEKKRFQDVLMFLSLHGTTETHLNIAKEFLDENYMDYNENIDPNFEFTEFFERRMISENNKFSNFSKYLEDRHSGAVILSPSTIFLSIVLAINILYHIE